ncbi:MAG: protein-glutamate O-methyltransferase CheR [candidate division Zixibacteria bacterium]|nr:protein-glutamate O-methyltransferase CheR [candidate division Zixibacteria bacterium]
MQKSTFDKIRSIVYETSGIRLGQDKHALVSARVSKRMRKLKIDDPKTYLNHVMNDPSGQEIHNLMDAISTNVTSFYREADHFDFMRYILKEWAAIGQKRFRIWCAASSTGEEPYTIAIEMLEALMNNSSDIRILATDINKEVLSHALIGEYDEKALSPVSKILKCKYFTKEKDKGILKYKIKENAKRLIAFRKFNLSHFPYPLKGPLDIIFCRNVMIYFDRELRSKLVNEFEKLLKPGGYLIVGHAESVAGISKGFKSIKPSIYLKD